MSFHEVRFPTDISFGSSGGPEYSTDVVVLSSGFESRNANWQTSRARYNIAHGVKNESQLAALIAFFRARKGKAYGFRFKDWSDFKGVAQNIGIGNASQTSFQIVKNYNSGSSSYIRKINKIVSGSVNVYLNSVLQTSGYSVNNNTGVITFTAAPASGVSITADYDFDVPVRFDTDSLSSSIDTYGVYSFADVPLVEIRI